MYVCLNGCMSDCLSEASVQALLAARRTLQAVMQEKRIPQCMVDGETVEGMVGRASDLLEVGTGRAC
jgi:hypothetical protein